MKKILSCLLLAVMLVTAVGIVPVSAKSKIKLNKKKISLELRESFKLKLKGVKSTEVQWASGSVNVALVTKKGKVTAVGEGKTKIYATYNGKTYKCTVTVTVQEGESHTISADEYDVLYWEAYELLYDKPCPITLPAEEKWYIASYGTSKETRNYWWNSRESYSEEAMTWVTTMECWVTESLLDYEDMSECISLLDSRDTQNYESVFAYWKDMLFAKIKMSSMNFDRSAEYLADSAEYIGDTAKGYPIIRYLCEYEGHIATVYITYNIEECVLQSFVLVNGEGSRMKPEIEKYLEEEIINQ